MIIIEKQAYEIPIATKKGWRTPAGLIGNINGIKVSYVVLPTDPVELVVSELSSGSHIRTFHLGIEEVAFCTTQNKLFRLLTEYSRQVEELLNNSINLDNHIKQTQVKAIKMLGPMPELKETTIGEEDNQ